MSEDSREDNVYMAKLAEQAERYDEVIVVLFIYYYNLSFIFSFGVLETDVLQCRWWRQ